MYFNVYYLWQKFIRSQVGFIPCPHCRKETPCAVGQEAGLSTNFYALFIATVSLDPSVKRYLSHQTRYIIFMFIYKCVHTGWHLMTVGVSNAKRRPSSHAWCVTVPKLSRWSRNRSPFFLKSTSRWKTKKRNWIPRLSKWLSASLNYKSLLKRRLQTTLRPPKRTTMAALVMRLLPVISILIYWFLCDNLLNFSHISCQS